MEEETNPAKRQQMIENLKAAICSISKKKVCCASVARLGETHHQCTTGSACMSQVQCPTFLEDMKVFREERD